MIFSKRCILSLAILVAICTVGESKCVQQQSPAKTLVMRSIRAMGNIVTLQGRLKRSERLAGAMSYGECTFKVNAKPLKLYFYSITPDPGAEILWVKGWSHDQAYVHPHKFPWVNVSLSVYSHNFVSRQHHCILKAGFSFIREILLDLVAAFGEEFDQHVRYQGQEKWDGKFLDVLKIRIADYGFVNYTVKAGENLFSLEDKLLVPAYKIQEINPQIDDRFDVSTGQVIKVPNFYAKEIVVMIDPDNHLPVVQLIYDDRGLFEKYEFSDLVINKPFPTEEFSEDCKWYGF